METCFLCGTLRSQHDDPSINHAFAREGEPLQRREANDPNSRSTPPMRRAPAQEHSVILNLVAVMTKKGMLTPSELAEVFGGVLHESTPGDGQAAH